MASDKLEGRATPSHGLDLAANGGTVSVIEIAGALAHPAPLVPVPLKETIANMNLE